MDGLYAFAAGHHRPRMNHSSTSLATSSGRSRCMKCPAPGVVSHITTPFGAGQELSGFVSAHRIPEQDLKNLFNRFFRASNAVERSVPGTGLGLSLSRAIIVDHGGEMDVESQEGIGTTMTVRLPPAGTSPPVELADVTCP
jgi:hypothetical protein